MSIILSRWPDLLQLKLICWFVLLIILCSLIALCKMKAVQTGTEHTWINTCAHCRETVVCVHRGKFPFCLSALFSLFFSVSLSHPLISSDLILVYSRSHVPGSQPRRQAAETTHLSQFSTLGTKDIPGSVPQHGEFLWPFPPESVFFRCGNTRDCPYVTCLPWAASMLGWITGGILIFREFTFATLLTKHKIYRLHFWGQWECF